MRFIKQCFLSWLILTVLMTSVYAKSANVLFPLGADLKKEFFGDREVLFDDEHILIDVPLFADNPAQVHISIDASYYKNAKKMIIFADRNLILPVLELSVVDVIPAFAFNIKLAQSSPLRVAVLDKKDIWHLFTADMQSKGNGCGVKSTPKQVGDVMENLGRYRSKLTKNGDAYDLKFSIFHPMETGILLGHSPFFIDHIRIFDRDRVVVDFEPTVVVSQNPRFEFVGLHGSGDFKVVMNDTDGNEFVINPKIEN